MGVYMILQGGLLAKSLAPPSRAMLLSVCQTGGRRNLQRREETRTMTTDTKVNIEALSEAVTKAEAALAEASAAAGIRTAEIIATIPATETRYFNELTAAAAPVTAASNRLEAVKAALEAGRANDRWESSIEVRQPILDQMRDMFITNKVVAPMTGISGTLKVVDGKAVYTLNPVFGKVEISTDDLEAITDVEKLVALGLDSIDINVTALTAENPVMSLTPTGAKSAQKAPAKAKSGQAEGSTETTRKGTKVFTWNGTEYGSKDFLEAVEASGHQVVADNAQSFQTALHGSKNGMSNLAESVAPKVGATFEYRTKE